MHNMAPAEDVEKAAPTIPVGMVTRALLLLNVGVFVCQLLYEGASLSRNQFIYGHFALSLSGSKNSSSGNW